MPKSGPRTTLSYSEEFKATAVRLSQLGGVAVQRHSHEMAQCRRHGSEGACRQALGRALSVRADSHPPGMRM